MYAMVCTRLDIAHAVDVVNHFLSNPSIEHWKAVKWILRYLLSTSNLKLRFGIGKPILCGYIDSDMARMLILGNLLLVFYHLFKGSCGSAIQVAKMCCIVYH